jgi:outer membrane protein assembly factor BamA
MTLNIKLLLVMAACCAAAPALAQIAPAPSAAPPAGDKPLASYILRGFRLSGAPQVDQDALVNGLGQKPGDRITSADIDADTKQLGAALEARHVVGQLFATLAVTGDRAWVLFDFQPAEKKPPRYFASQNFDGNVKISSAALAAAIALRPGDLVNADRLNAAERSITAAYAKSAPGVKIRISGKIRTTKTGQVTVMWHIAELTE